MSGTRPKSSKVLARQWRVLLMLSRRECRVLEVARRFGVSKGAIEHDLATLEAAGFPVVVRSDGGHRQALRWSVNRDVLAGMVAR
jgi:predicted DNA-binding transcriptional regulator YafY